MYTDSGTASPIPLLSGMAKNGRIVKRKVMVPTFITLIKLIRDLEMSGEEVFRGGCSKAVRMEQDESDVSSQCATGKFQPNYSNLFSCF